MEHRLALSLRIGEQEEEIALPELVLGFKNHSPSDYFESKDRHEEKDELKNIRTKSIEHIGSFHASSNLHASFAFILPRLIATRKGIQSAQKELLEVQSELQRRAVLGVEQLAIETQEKKKNRRKKETNQISKTAINREKATTQNLVTRKLSLTAWLGQVVPSIAQSAVIMADDQLKIGDLIAANHLAGNIHTQDFGNNYILLLDSTLAKAEELGYLKDREAFLKTTPEEAIAILEELKLQLEALIQGAPYEVKSISGAQKETQGAIQKL